MNKTQPFDRLAERLRRARQRLATGDTIPPRPAPEMLPLSFTQERFWILDQFDPGHPAYNRPILLRLRGNLALEAVQQAFNEIIRRHDALRATFLSEEGQPKQIILPPFDLPLTVTDISQRQPGQEAAAVRDWRDGALAQPFDLATGPLLRVELLRLEPDHHLLLLVAQHILFDAWSARIFIRELIQLYDAFVEGQPSPLPDLPIQYADFAHWQRSRSESGQMQNDLAYWETQLADAPPYLELPLDHQRPKLLGHEGALHTHLFPDDLVTQLKTLSQRADVTLFMTLLAAFKVLLHHYSGQTDIIVGSPVAGRTHTELEPLIGVLFNTLVLRTDLAGDPPFSNLLNRVRQTALAAYAHQTAPFEKLVEMLNPPRDLSRTPIFQALFNFENLVDTFPTSPHLTVEEVEFDHHRAYYEIMVEVMETKAGLTGLFLYKTDLFEADTVAGLAKDYQTILEKIVDNPEIPIAGLDPLLKKPAMSNPIPFSRFIIGHAQPPDLIERLPPHNAALSRYEPFWAETLTDYPTDACIHHLFEAQVERTPDAIAIRFDQTTLTYRDLNQRANQLAHHLQRLGVGPETLVGLCVERSPEMIVGLLGILKAGGAYIPLDPTYPQKRLAFIIEDTQTAVLLTQRHLLERLPDYVGRFICLDDPQNDAWQQADTNPTSTVTAENLAYIIYTSGSTGQPKGVMIEHRALVNFTEMIAAYYDINAFDRVLQFASISFDASAEEIYPTLTRGATLALRTDEMLASGDIFWQRCEAWGLTVLDLPTAYWHQLVSDLPKMERLFPKFIRLVILGGEKARADAVNVWLEHTPPSLRTVNSYGPTEATVVATVYEIADKIDGANVPIGQPIGNVQAYVLDEQMQPVPVGLPGELHLGGVGLARGYLNRPELTAERFVTASIETDIKSSPPSPPKGGAKAEIPPAGGPGGRRLYKTGDLVRYRPDGCLEFLGRLDNQIKLRGFRIELGEIETTLAQHPDVQEAAVILREDQPGQQRLVAYIIPQPASEPTQESLSTFLKDKLPDYMLPAAFVTLENLPLTTNGKIDRHILPAPDVTRPDTANDVVVASDDPVEAMLTEMWQKLLGVQSIGRQDNFFQLGGHSLLAIQLVTRLREAYDIDLSLRKLFESPTIADLAVAIEEMLMIEIKEAD